MTLQPTDTKFVIWFEDLSRDDVPIVGGKNASLGEMVRRLKPQGVLVPPGFASTSSAYREYVEANGIARALAQRLEALARGQASLHDTGEAVRRLFLDGEFPAPIAEAIREAYRKLSAEAEAAEASVAVRSSATAEDLPDASFAGQQETFLNVRGEREHLTQLLLGVDRDSSDLARLFDERNEAVKRFVREAIQKAHAAGIKIGICGQAPSNYPEFAAYLVECGVDSISLNPDSFVTTVKEVAHAEQRLLPERRQRG